MTSRRTAGLLAFPNAWVCFWLLIGFLPLGPASIKGQQTSEIEGKLQQESRLRNSFQQTQTTENGITNRLRSEIIQSRADAQRLEQQLSFYQLQVSSLRNLLLVSSTTIDEFSQGIALQQQALQELRATLSQSNQSLQPLEERRLRAQVRQEIYQQQVNELKNLSQETIPRSLLTLIDKISFTQRDNRNNLDQLLKTKKEEIARLQETRDENKKLLGRLQKNLEKQHQEMLFEQQEISLAKLGPTEIAGELERILRLMNRWSQIAEIQFGFQRLWNGYRFLLITFPFLFGIGFLLLRTARHSLLNWLKDTNPPFWKSWTLHLLFQSLIPIGTLGLLWACEQSMILADLNPLLALFRSMLLLWIFVFWCLRALERFDDDDFVSVRYAAHRLLRWVRSLGLVYLLLQQLLGSNSVLLLIARLVLGIGVLVLSVGLGRQLRRWIQLQEHRLALQRTSLSLIISSLPTLIIGSGLLLELAGYSHLSLYWSVSLSKTSIVLFWGFLCWRCIQEWDAHLGAKPIQTDLLEVDAQTMGQQSTNWLIGRIAWLVGAGLIGLGLLLAWGAEKEVFLRTWEVFHQPLTVGSLELSLIGFVYAFIILLITRATVLLWRYLFKQRLMAHSHIEEGTQESVATIGTYAIWGIGVLFGLGSLGVNSSSLAVAFGAVGIGLGFGLQNIFNNFVSGLILLFERPIQVGSIVEINGIWGVVKKVNVRSTLVQTYDNASLIIPNSEFISQTVKNWSYKDPRVRRTIDIGVAYGTDPKLIRTEMLAVAEKHPKVLKVLAPVVHFIDFGDSALMFRLYYYTTLDFGMISETELRLQIDERFRELGIVIPFPQRDVHFHIAESGKTPSVAKSSISTEPSAGISENKTDDSRMTLLQQLWKGRPK
jgi:small-conductance mechanosensitive channel